MTCLPPATSATSTPLTIGVEGAGAQGVVYIDDVCLYPEVIENVSSDITGPGDTVQGVPNDGVTTGNNDNGWPSGEYPDLAIDDDTSTKFLHFKGNAETTGLQVTPLVGATVVTGLTFTTANDAAERDPTSFELYGSNDSIDGAYTLIASGEIVDFAGETAWERYTKDDHADHVRQRRGVHALPDSLPDHSRCRQCQQHADR